ncbi:thiol-activated cytolysin family protein [Clostridium botulinum]|uniref:thiol-activated cytolysin family protein n=1 Tax=Clostridium botulinum TaxID=1491 RepID=UPI001C9B88CC|nr:thiol-activated cytolysin family protein [Clostridium botulinum]MBY6809176.1 thiol-activated cytolysin family protein [Clostridium botulinum]MBY6822618.1 thiol-activated cytolysin family protein [Clostridium botulinum]MBY6833230.1 thiol-activated cytolysin family protein [Clostridium botulinum]MBY6971291.1 thiol-activated cytolysin family protein [Clostridium botulinum]HBJ1649852.1 thiol-activated cytolysin family protein [Clostridium botulinum]
MKTTKKLLKSFAQGLLAVMLINGFAYISDFKTNNNVFLSGITEDNSAKETTDKNVITENISDETKNVVTDNKTDNSLSEKNVLDEGTQTDGDLLNTDSVQAINPITINPIVDPIKSIEEPIIEDIPLIRDTLKNEINDIDKNIYGLSYNPDKILSSKGESVDSFVPAQGFDTPNKYIVVKREKKSISDSTADISIIDSINDRTYPGAIQLANRNLVENKPDIISCKRKPITISVDLPGMSEDGSKVVNSPTYSTVNSSINSLLDTWNTKYASKYTIPTRMSYTDAMVYSKSQLSTMFGCNFKILDKALNIDFNSIFKGEKQAMVVAYKQIFYTVSVDAPEKPSDLFGDNVSFHELALKGVDNENPPAYVSNVAYGRTIYVKLETTSKSANVKAAFKALVSNQDISGNTEYEDILEQSSFTATVLGGGAEAHNKVVTKDFNEIQNIIQNNSVYSPKNPGYPISYTSTFLKDNRIATVNNKTEYIETTSTEYTNGKIVLDHSGAYVAQFEVTWDEVSYDKDGNEIIEHKIWSGSDKDKTAHFNTEIYLKGNARNISVKAWECTGLAWEWWRQVIDAQNIPLVKERTFSIWGTTLYPNKSVEPEI